MTRQRTFKRRVRERMAKTGESYTAARRMLIADGDSPEPAVADWVRPSSEEAVSAATGRGWEAWLALIDGFEGTSRSHGEIVAWLRGEHGVAGWWAQNVAVGYERARGMRAFGEGANGFTATASRTVAVPVERLYAAWSELERRERWLPGAELGVRKENPPRGIRYDWEDGSSRVVVGFDAAGPAKSRVAMSHERLADADSAEAMRGFWRERMTALKTMLEAGELDG